MQAIANAFLEAVTPGCHRSDAADRGTDSQANHDAALSQWRLGSGTDCATMSEKAERRYRTVEPENRLVARGLES